MPQAVPKRTNPKTADVNEGLAVSKTFQTGVTWTFLSLTLYLYSTILISCRDGLITAPAGSTILLTASPV